jgi:hypothetical protein
MLNVIFRFSFHIVSLLSNHLDFDSIFSFIIIKKLITREEIIILRSPDQ